MYGVSEAYKTAMQRPVHRFKLVGTVGETEFTETDVLTGSLSITNQFSSGSDFKIGSVVIGTMACTFLRTIQNVNEGDLITLSEGLRLADRSYEYVPLGVFKVAEASRVASGTVVKAYDAMANFDKNFPLSNTFGTPYALAELACEACGVELGMTEAEMKNLPNGLIQLNLYPENDISSWRDFLYWLSQACACFCTIDRAGKLVFRRFTGTPVDAIDSSHRFQGASFSNFSTKYTGVSFVNLGDKTTSYYGMEQDDGLTYNMGGNPFLQYGSAEDKEAMRRAVLNGFGGLEFTPFNATVRVGGVYDLGDVLTQSGGIGAGSRVCVMRYVWKYGKYQMEGVGKNPALASAKSKVDKQIQGLISSTQQEILQYYVYSNAERISIGNGEQKKIIDIRFASARESTVLFQAEILLTSTAIDETTVCNVIYKYNSSVVAEWKPVETYFDGKHILHLLYPIKIDTAMVSRLEVLLNLSGGGVVINAGDIRSMAYGQGLVGASEWDGLIELTDEIGIMQVSSMGRVSAMGLTESSIFAFQTPESAGPSDTISIISVIPMQKVSMMGLVHEEVETTLKEVEET